MSKNDFTKFNTNKGDDRENTVVNFSINSNSPFPIGLIVISKIKYKYESVHKLAFINQYACNIFNISPTIKINSLREIFTQYKILGYKNELGATLDSILFDEKITNEYCASFLNSNSMVYIKFRRNKDSIYLVAELYNDERKNIQKKLFTSLKYQYLATLYHELNNPLNALLSMTEEQSRIFDKEQENEDKFLLNLETLENEKSSIKKPIRSSKSLNIGDKNNNNINLANRSYNGDIDINTNNIFRTMYEKEKQIFILTRLIKTFSTNFLFYLKLNLNVDGEDFGNSVIGSKIKTNDFKSLKNNKNNSSNFLINPSLNINKEIKNEKRSSLFCKNDSNNSNQINLKNEMKLNLEYLFKNFLEEFNCLFEYKDIHYDINFDILADKFIVTDEQRSYYFIRQIYTYLYYIIPRKSFFSVTINLIKIDTIKIIFKKAINTKKHFLNKCKKKLTNIDPAFMKEFNVAKTVKTQEITREILYSLSELLHFTLKIEEEEDEKYLTLIIPNVTLEELSDVDEDDIDEIPKNQKNNILQNIDEIMSKDNNGSMIDGSNIYNGSIFSHDRYKKRNSTSNYSMGQKYNSSFSNDKFKSRRYYQQYNKFMMSPKLKRIGEETGYPGFCLENREESGVDSSGNSQHRQSKNHSQRRTTLFKKQSLENSKLWNLDGNNNKINILNAYSNSTSKKSGIYKIAVNGNENYKTLKLDKSSSSNVFSSGISGQVISQLTRGEDEKNNKKQEAEIPCLHPIRENSESFVNESKANVKSTVISIETGGFCDKTIPKYNSTPSWNKNEANNNENQISNNNENNDNNNDNSNNSSYNIIVDNDNNNSCNINKIINDNKKIKQKSKNNIQQKKSGYYQSKLKNYGIEILYENTHVSEPQLMSRNYSFTQFNTNPSLEKNTIKELKNDNSLNNNSAGSSLKAEQDSENPDNFNSDFDLTPTNANINNNNYNINSENSSTSNLKIKDDKLNFSFGVSPKNSVQNKNNFSINNNLNIKRIMNSPIRKIQQQDLSAISESSEDLEIYASNICNCNDIMFVDDEIFNVKTAQNVFKKIDIGIDVAYNGQECLDLIKKKKISNCKCNHSKYKIIFMDIMMPILDGIAAAKEIQLMINEGEINKIDIIFVSTYSSMNLKAQVKEIICAKEYLAKPVPLSKYKEILNKYYFPQSTG